MAMKTKKGASRRRRHGTAQTAVRKTSITHAALREARRNQATTFSPGELEVEIVSAEFKAGPSIDRVVIGAKAVEEDGSLGSTVDLVSLVVGDHVNGEGGHVIDSLAILDRILEAAGLGDAGDYTAVDDQLAQLVGRHVILDLTAEVVGKVARPRNLIIDAYPVDEADDVAAE